MSPAHADDGPLGEVLSPYIVPVSYLYQILNGRRTPSREKALRLCIGAGLSLEETQRVLELGKLGVLYPRDRRDAILIFAVRSGLDTTETDDLLDQFGEALLG